MSKYETPLDFRSKSGLSSVIVGAPAAAGSLKIRCFLLTPAACNSFAKLISYPWDRSTLMRRPACGGGISDAQGAGCRTVDAGSVVSGTSSSWTGWGAIRLLTTFFSTISRGRVDYVEVLQELLMKEEFKIHHLRTYFIYGLYNGPGAQLSRILKISWVIGARSCMRCVVISEVYWYPGS